MSWPAVQQVVPIKLPPREKVVLLCLADTKNLETGRCFPGTAYIAEWCQLSQASVKAATAELQRLGLIRKLRRLTHMDFVLNLDLKGTPEQPESGPSVSQILDHGQPESGPHSARISTTDSQNLDINLGTNQGKNLGREPKTKPSENAKASRVTDPRHSLCMKELNDYWRLHNELDMDWKKAGAQLKRLLDPRPSMSIEKFRECLLNREKSEAVNHSQEPYEWLGKLSSYQNGPLNKFKQPKGASDGHGAYAGKTASTVSAAWAALEATADHHASYEAEYPPASAPR